MPKYPKFLTKFGKNAHVLGFEICTTQYLKFSAHRRNFPKYKLYIWPDLGEVCQAENFHHHPVQMLTDRGCIYHLNKMKFTWLTTKASMKKKKIFFLPWTFCHYEIHGHIKTIFFIPTCKKTKKQGKISGVTKIFLKFFIIRHFAVQTWCILLSNINFVLRFW